MGVLSSIGDDGYLLTSEDVPRELAGLWAPASDAVARPVHLGTVDAQHTDTQPAMGVIDDIDGVTIHHAQYPWLWWCRG
ncbi:hypothetical protein Y900_027640 [Mycolicibacterium aromaticivorans JS19b1 = JCM 16368]|uniref:Uncharacterized protein n=1 Tax=Mycolicibacterium aromaticivorans JS19b1 = JCM 16368 TaxID=1440774 RepID=A0A064C8U5_9MYCO|nr:hypothetical protein [Mycolicibacterium aromaticivorans]KDE97064.1 hypothetical protein Y900_027640 [Mycolicibacterium aromaticivorans JS19b1 = JCM 16368]